MEHNRSRLRGEGGGEQLVSQRAGDREAGGGGGGALSNKRCQVRLCRRR